MSYRADTIETGKRAKPLRRCINPSCGVLLGNPRSHRCGPCDDKHREDSAKRRYAARKLVRQSEQQTTT